MQAGTEQVARHFANPAFRRLPAPTPGIPVFICRGMAALFAGNEYGSDVAFVGAKKCHYASHRGKNVQDSRHRGQHGGDKGNFPWRFYWHQICQSCMATSERPDHPHSIYITI